MFATRQALETRFGLRELQQLTDRTGAADAVDEEMVSAALGVANDMVSGYLLSAGYSLPLAQPDASVNAAALDIARWNLYTYERPEDVQLAYQAAVSYLQRISSGAVTLVQEPESAPRGVAVGERRVTFTDDLMERFTDVGG